MADVDLRSHLIRDAMTQTRWETPIQRRGDCKRRQRAVENARWKDSEIKYRYTDEMRRDRSYSSGKIFLPLRLVGNGRRKTRGQKESAPRGNCSSSRDKGLMQFRIYCFCRCRRRTHVVRFGIYRLISPAIALATVGEIVAAWIATCSLKYGKHRENDDTLMEAGESSISCFNPADTFENISNLSMHTNRERDT